MEVLILKHFFGLFEVTVASCIINILGPRSSLCRVCFVRDPEGLFAYGNLLLYRNEYFLSCSCVIPPAQLFCLITQILMTPGALLLLLTSPCPIHGSSSGGVLLQSCELGISQCRRNTELMRIRIFLFFSPDVYRALSFSLPRLYTCESDF